MDKYTNNDTNVDRDTDHIYQIMIHMQIKDTYQNTDKNTHIDIDTNKHTDNDTNVDIDRDTKVNTDTDKCYKGTNVLS